MRGKAYFIGGGVGSLSGAIYMIRDGNVNPKDITIFEALHVSGGSCDGEGEAKKGYLIRGGRMLNLPTYECLWDLLKFIPSLEKPNMCIYDEIVQFNKENPTESRARLVDHNQKIIDVRSMGFTMKHRIDLLQLISCSEESLGDKKIIELFDSDFFHTNFWYMWSTTFAFQTWHSAAELRRYMIRFMHEFLRIHTLEGVARTPYNQYDSIILPLQKWLEEKGVNFEYNTICNDIEIEIKDTTKTVTSISLIQNDNNRKINIGCDDIVILQNGSMTDGAGIGNMTEVAKSVPSTSWKLWEKLAKISPDFGNPDSFTRSIKESLWYSFTVTINNDSSFFDQEIKFTSNVPGQGALVTFKDSNWLMSIVVPKQPHFKNQPENCQVFWGYGLFPDRVGNFVNKSMLECTGAEILDELIGHFGFDKSLFKNAICITCVMPYITAQFMTRHRTDRPLPVPKGCTNLGMTSQFVEIPNDVVFTVEYSVRSAQMAVYQLLNIKKQIPAISHHENKIAVKIKCVKKAFAGSDWEIIKLIFIIIIISIFIKALF